MQTAAALIVCAILLLVSQCTRVAPAFIPSRAPIAFGAITWNVGAGRATLGAFVDDLVSGRLLGTAPEHFVLLLQEIEEPELATLATTRGLS